MGYPNHEVESSLTNYLLGYYREGGPAESQSICLGIKRALANAGDLVKLMVQIDRLFSTIPHQILILVVRDFSRDPAHHISRVRLADAFGGQHSPRSGRQRRLHPIEGSMCWSSSLMAPASSALSQIREKRYGSAYLGQGQPVIAVGIRFSSDTRTVAEWESKPYEELLAEG